MNKYSLTDIRRIVISEIKKLITDVNFEAQDKLVDDNILLPYNIVFLVYSLNDIFDVEITNSDLQKGYLNSIDKMVELIDKKIMLTSYNIII